MERSPHSQRFDLIPSTTCIENIDIVDKSEDKSEKDAVYPVEDAGA